MSDALYMIINTWLQGGYVFLTLILAGVAIWSAWIASKYSRKALLATQKQSEESIALINKQITLSERQAQEALYNQHKPVIVPNSNIYSPGKRIDIMEFTMQNKGSGVALNTWGVLTNTETNQFYRFRSTCFLVPSDKPEGIEIIAINESLDFMFPDKVFSGYSLYPDFDTNDKNSGIRLIVTYNDIFNNKYLAIFDKSELFGWRQFGEAKQIEQRLDEHLVEKRLMSHPKS